MTQMKIALRANNPEAYAKHQAERNKQFHATKVPGFDPRAVSGFVVEVIRDLIALPLEQVSIDFVKNHPMNIRRFKD